MTFQLFLILAQLFNYYRHGTGGVRGRVLRGPHIIERGQLLCLGSAATGSVTFHLCSWSGCHLFSLYCARPLTLFLFFLFTLSFHTVSLTAQG